MRWLKPTILTSMLVAVLAAGLCDFAYAQRRTRRDTGDADGEMMERGIGRTRPTREQAAQEKMAQAQTEATNAARVLDDQVGVILRLVNEQQTPDATLLARAKTALDQSLKHTKVFDEQLQCLQHLLGAWLTYYQGDVRSAALRGVAAYKADPMNHDAYVTQAALAILTDRPPVVVAPRTNRPTTEEETRREEAAARRAAMRGTNTRPEQALSYPVASVNLLSFDVDALRVKLLGKQLAAMQVECVNSTTFAYEPGRDTLCLMFWQLRSAGSSSEPNNVPPGAAPGMPIPQPQQGMPQMQPMPGPGGPGYQGDMGGYRGGGMPGRDPYSYGGGYSQLDPYGRPMMMAGVARPQGTLESEMAAFGRIFAMAVEQRGVKLLAVNKDEPARRKEVVAEILRNPWPWAHVVANNPLAANADFGSLDARRPILVIAGPTGAVKYAGPAEGFVAPMVLKHLLVASAMGTTPPQQPQTAQPQPPAQPKTNPLTSLLPKPASPTAPPAAAAGDDASMDDLLENPDQYDAAKQLEYARGLFIPAGRKGPLTSKQGVEICRRIIQKWPNTTYADEARQLLRQVPENERIRYGITNEEMGL